MIGSLDFLERGVRVVLLMGIGVIPTVEINVVFRFPVVWQRLSRDLSASNTTAVGERGDKQDIDASVLLEAVKHWSNPFIDKRNGAHLYGNCGGSSARLL